MQSFLVKFNILTFVELAATFIEPINEFLTSFGRYATQGFV